jgi:hypothetical protein
MSDQRRQAPLAPAFVLGSDIRDWDSGAILENYVGLVVRFGARPVLMRTWFDASSGERAWASVRVLE